MTATTHIAWDRGALTEALANVLGPLVAFQTAPKRKKTACGKRVIAIHIDNSENVTCQNCRVQVFEEAFDTLKALRTVPHTERDWRWEDTMDAALFEIDRFGPGALYRREMAAQRLMQALFDEPMS